MTDSNEPKKMKMMEQEQANTSETDSKETSDSSETVQSPFSVKTWKEDLKLIVEGKEIYVNKAVLAYLSPVFETMCTADFKEKDCDELELPGKSYESFIEFLECFYPAHNKVITAENAKFILPLAHEYQIQTPPGFLTQLDKELSNTIRPDPASAMSNVYTHLKLAWLFNLPQTLTKCTTVASKQTLAEIKAYKEKYGLSSELQEQILEHGFKRQELQGLRRQKNVF